MSAYIRDRTENGVRVPEINGDTLQDLEESLPEYGVSDKQLLFMRVLERRTPYPGALVQVTPSVDYSLAWASGGDEFLYLFSSLQARGFLGVSGGKEEVRSEFSFETVIEPAGWEYLEANKRTGAISDQVFVAMSFADESQSAWEDAIRPAVAGCGYKPYRVDAEPHLDRIDSKIVAETKNSTFLVADVTHQRPGVYFEAGYALGLGLKVFWSVRADEIEKVHFDTRQYNHIVLE
ncbi:MAG: hypothetical protein U5O39_10885 [Gammaproteobacteria bacterium]|nr:hypothetical protein [Gammaproteobacteria bacterium]